jgi:integrator complex subunit 2
MNVQNVTQETVVKSASMLRLYTALRGIAGLKFTEEEIGRLMDLITSRPPVTSAGVKFVSLGLCMLIACNSLTGSSNPARAGELTLEQRAILWINWLVEQEATFEQKVACSASFAEMLLLMAIHFHSNQLNAIGDLVFQTLGMKRGEIAIRTNSMSRIKQIFTHEVFTDKKVASHAVRVPVTKNLSAHIAGFLPVHCVHQLLKSRAFSKYKVPIKDWVFKQICVCTTPLHPVMPALIETFVNSILVPASSRGSSSNYEQTNEPISEKQVRAVFRKPAFVESNTICSTACATPAINRSPKRKSRSRESTPATFRLFTPSQTPTSSRSASPSHSLSIPGSGALNSSIIENQEFNITTQILMLYYILLYESVRLSHMKTILTSQRKGRL